MKKTMLLFTVLALLPFSVSAQSGDTTVIQNGTIYTVTNGTLSNGSVLIRDGKIAAVGTNIDVPAGAQVIDASGQFVMPGIIDPHSHVASESTNEGSIAVSSMTDILDVLDPDDINIYRELAGGVTTTNVLHGSANPIGGTKSIIKLRWGKDAKGLLMENVRPGIKFAMGENVKRSSSANQRGVERRYPATRMGTLDVMRRYFTAAREYQEEWKRYEERAGEENLIPPRRDLQLDPLVEVLDGRMLVHVHAYRSDEILQMIRLAEDFGFKVHTMEHVLEGYQVAKELAEHGTWVLTFSDWWAYKMEAYHAIPYNAALLMEKGANVALKSDSQEEARHLNQEAAKCMKWGGITEDQALELITINAAKSLGIEDRVGSIEVGKDADFVIYNKPPLSVYAVAQKTIIDGVVYFDRDKDLEMRKAMEEEKKGLLEKMKKEKPEKGKEVGR